MSQEVGKVHQNFYSTYFHFVHNLSSNCYKLNNPEIGELVIYNNNVHNYVPTGETKSKIIIINLTKVITPT